MTAHSVRLARLVAGVDEEETVDAEVGALLAAEAQAEIHGLHEMVKAYMEAMSRAP